MADALELPPAKPFVSPYLKQPARTFQEAVDCRQASEAREAHLATVAGFVVRLKHAPEAKRRQWYDDYMSETVEGCHNMPASMASCAARWADKCVEEERASALGAIELEAMTAAKEIAEDLSVALTADQFGDVAEKAARLGRNMRALEGALRFITKIEGKIA